MLLREIALVVLKTVTRDTLRVITFRYEDISNDHSLISPTICILSPALWRGWLNGIISETFRTRHFFLVCELFFPRSELQKSRLRMQKDRFPLRCTCFVALDWAPGRFDVYQEHRLAVPMATITFSTPCESPRARQCHFGATRNLFQRFLRRKEWFYPFSTSATKSPLSHKYKRTSLSPSARTVYFSPALCHKCRKTSLMQQIQNDSPHECQESLLFPEWKCEWCIKFYLMKN